jgi:hypothetical protein
MKYFITIVLVILVFVGCKTQARFVSSNYSSLVKSGKINNPIVFYAQIERPDSFTKSRVVLLFLFNENEILYKIPSIECRGGLYFFSTFTCTNNEITFTHPHQVRNNYHTKYVVNTLTVVNDSTIIGYDKSIFKKLPDCTEDGYSWKYWLKSALAKRNYYFN